MEESGEETNTSLEQSKSEEDMVWKPKYDMEFDSEQAAYDFYNEYGRNEGFSIRKEVCAKDKNHVLTSRLFVCCKEGLRGKDKRDDLTKNPRAHTRTGCGAHMGIRLVRRTGKYCVYRFHEEHNHPLVKQECVHRLPSQRKMTTPDGAFLELTSNSGVPSKSAFELMSKEAGGRESLGFTKEDQKNYLRTVRQRKMKFGEAGYLMEYFSKQTLENPSFFYEMQLDSEEQITNIFWADAKMIMDYAIFGDVVSFDTTYKINEANRPLAVFVGLNHHRETIIFGAALMYDETAASFIWLFNTFLKAMCGKPPRTFFTDQDAAIAKAVLHVMPDTYHRLCIWHLMQNALKKVGFLFRNSNGDENQGNVLNKFLYQIEEENEFLSAWESMLDDYNAHDDPWLAATFAIRKKWVHAYVKWTWSAGMESTQLSESFNATLKGYLKSDYQLPDFFTHFERMVADKRYKELEAEYDLQFRIVHCKMEVIMLKHAREVYTKTIFKYFQAQFEDSLNYSITKCVSDENFIFTVVRDGFTKERLVKREGEFTVSCSCRMFETEGILCRHAIKVMIEGRETTLIKKIPEQYVLERWTKTARVDNIVEDMHGHEIIENPRLKQISRNRNLCYKFVRIASRASESEKAYELVVMEADKLAKIVEDVLRLEINGDKDVEDQDQNVLADCFNAKGFKKRQATHRGKRRAKGDFEAALSKSKKKPSQVAKVRNHSAAMNQSHAPSSHQSQVIGISTAGKGIELCSQSSSSLSQSSQVSIHPPMMVGNDQYMQLLRRPYNIHDLNMSNGMFWMPSQESSVASTQAYVQSNIIGFPSTLQDPGMSNHQEL